MASLAEARKRLAREQKLRGVKWDDFNFVGFQGRIKVDESARGTAKFDDNRRF